MSDAFKKARRGEPVKIAAAAWNRVIDQVVTKPRFTGEDEAYPHINVQVRVKNFTTGTLDRWGVLQIDSLLETPTGVTGNAVESFQSWPGVVGVVPGISSARTKSYVVAVEPIPAGNIGRGAIAGVVQSRVQVRCTGHNYAQPKTNAIGYMESADSGPFKILWIGATGPTPTGATGPGAPWALLMFGTERAHETIPNYATGATQLLGHGKATTGASGCDSRLEWYTMTECSGTPSYASSYFL